MSLSVYPSGLDGFAEKADNVDYVLAAHVNYLQHAVSGLQYTVGRIKSPTATPAAGSAAVYRTPLNAWVSEGDLRVSGLSSQIHYLIPSGAFVLGGTYNWVTAPTTGCGYLHFGISGNLTAWADTVSISGTSGRPTTYTIGGASWFPQGANVVVTASGGEFGGGLMRVAITYLTLVPPPTT